jgi:hypothetical protein
LVFLTIFLTFGSITSIEVEVISSRTSSIGSFIVLGAIFILDIILFFIFCKFNNSSPMVIMSVNFINLILHLKPEK